MKRILFDADLTMGVPDCDVDDGLALLYAIGYGRQNPGDVEIVGLCTSYGNSTIDIVYENSRTVLTELGLDIPLLKGAPNKDEPLSEAARFLVDQANAFPGEISLSVTGSTTNLKGALQIDSDVLMKFREIIFMGGITQTLVFNGKIMDELNFSCDYEASLEALSLASKGARITVMTANNCLPAYFTYQDFEENLRHPGHEDGGYLVRTCKPWFETMDRWYGLDGFCCWDVLVPAYILEPELFSHEVFDIVLDPKLLSAGFLEPGFDGAPCARVNVPRIRNAQGFCSNAYDRWRASTSVS